MQRNLPAALADFFFIAGLEGNEPSILRGASLGGLRDATTIQEPILEEPSATETKSNVETTHTESIRSSANYTVPPSLSDFASESGTEVTSIIDDVIAKFSSERDEFLLTLAPPTIPLTPAIEVEEENGDNVPELQHLSVGPSIRSRSSLRNRLTDSLRRTGTLRRGGTTVSRRSSKRSSNTYNAVIPTPEPLILPPGTHPLKRKLAPRLLGIWPTSSMPEYIQERGNPPDYLPMFAFPNDIQVRLSDERPRSTWHGFTMTKANGEKVHVCCVTIWHPVPAAVAAELESQCNEWRQGNLTLEERQLAEALSSKLASERALLSSLLQFLPSLTGDERDEVDERILQCEEKIGLYNDLLKPVRLHAAAKVEGLTEGHGMWLPRCYGLLGRDGGYQTVWREWLRAIAVPWVFGEVDVDLVNPHGQAFVPLERYVVNICGEVPLPIQNRNQVEISVRELRLYAAKDNVYEIPGWRDTDLYPLFRALSLRNIVTLFEATISEARIIFRSSYPAMLHSAARALVHILWPLKFSGVYIPVLPSRLLSCLEAPVSYIIGIDRKYERLELPTDDFLLCDLDQDSIVFSACPAQLPPILRQKLGNLLAAAAPLHLSRGIPTGPPEYVKECYPKNCFTADKSVLTSRRSPARYGKFVGSRSVAFTDTSSGESAEPPVFNAFQYAMQQEEAEYRSFVNGYGSNGTVKSINSVSSFDPSKYATVSSRPSFSGSTALRDMTASLRNPGTRTSGLWPSIGRPAERNMYAQPTGHTGSGFFHRKAFSDTSSLNGYAVSISHSSTAASSILNFDALAMPIQKVEESEMHQWREGHSLRWKKQHDPTDCNICFDLCTGGIFVCDDCRLSVHHHCIDAITLPCLSAANFSADRIRAAFLRCFASLLFNYRKHLEPLPPQTQNSGEAKIFNFKLAGFLRAAPRDSAGYLEILSETQAFNEFIMERCIKTPDDPEIALFDQIILAKRNRGRHGLFGKQVTPLLSNPPPANLEIRKSIPPNEAKLPSGWQVPTNPPAKLDPMLILPARLAQPRNKYSRERGMIRRKPVKRSNETMKETS